MQAHILILEDDADVAYAAQLSLRRTGARITTLAHPGQLANALQESAPDVVLLDLNFQAGRTDGSEGMQALARLRALTNPPQVIVMTAYADVALAVEAMKCGAADFITKPWDNARLAAAVDEAMIQRTTSAAPTQNSALMGDSPPMKQLRRLIASVAPTEANVLVLGENGVGKELAARAIHEASRRATGQFLAVDMGSLPETTLESELFGHRKGSFTDARNDRAGRFLAASGGTLFLDEIGNMPLPAQAKLLTALERREVTPLGADRPQTIDVRIVSATNLAEASLYDPQHFRPDLLFRLNTIVLRVPPLRERREDIPLLLNHYLAHYQRQYGKPARQLSPSALDALCSNPWQGNVRALRHACERAVILCDGENYALADFGMAQPEMAPAVNRAADTIRLDALERDAIAAALAQVQGNISRAARLLGVSRAALYRKLGKYGL
ncbi:sigma-54-dependent transcriptional regulator [Massilia endophytica]|uniref:sigma-54-dependent transcriptional regulator n=1 Tax=Massilia endophytica TaxID=2899220 RepID=UPI001E533150|nr:sigma-54 dependent transcriptional regulator [Massilia endophytica]UGQ45436.1 sigma-54 dependent transcriptional regulator [Massilia endophytica]